MSGPLCAPGWIAQPVPLGIDAAGTTIDATGTAGLVGHARRMRIGRRGLSAALFVMNRVGLAAAAANAEDLVTLVGTRSSPRSGRDGNRRRCEFGAGLLTSTANAGAARRHRLFHACLSWWAFPAADTVRPSALHRTRTRALAVAGIGARLAIAAGETAPSRLAVWYTQSARRRTQQRRAARSGGRRRTAEPDILRRQLDFLGPARLPYLDAGAERTIGPRLCAEYRGVCDASDKHQGGHGSECPDGHDMSSLKARTPRTGRPSMSSVPESH